MSLTESTLEFFYDEDKVTQLRFHLTDDDPHIVNKHLNLSKIHFIRPVILFYEKHRTIDNKLIVEYFCDDEMESYTETIASDHLRVIKCFSHDGVLYAEEKIEFDSRRKAISVENWIKNHNGTITSCKDILE